MNKRVCILGAYFFFLACFGLVPARAELLTSKVVITSDDLETVHDLLGQKLNLTQGSEYKLLYFWATWCPNCKEKFRGALNDFKKIPKLDLILISTEKDSELVKNYIEKEKIGDPIFLDTQKTLRKLLHLDAIPAWALVKRNQETLQVVATESGFDEKDVLNQVMKALEK